MTDYMVFGYNEATKRAYVLHECGAQHDAPENKAITCDVCGVSFIVSGEDIERGHSRGYTILGSDTNLSDEDAST